MGNGRSTLKGLQYEIAKGAFRPHTALTNMALAYYQNDSNYFGRTIFPTCKVNLSSDNYYIFDKEDLLRDDWKRKPAYGKVEPSPVSEHTATYTVHVDQIIKGIDQIRQTDIDRRQAPGSANPKAQRVRVIAHQSNIHQDLMFANAFFKAGVWANEFEGVDSTTPGTGKFIKWSNANSDPIAFIDQMKTNMLGETGREPNRLAMGINVFNALKNHPAIKERVIHGGSTANPATVNMNVIAALLGLERISVLKSIRNKADFGQDADMGFIGDPDAFLLAYVTDSPSTEEPSAGYTFTWDMLGNGQLMPIMNYLGEDGTHSEYVEGLMAVEMKKTADDLAYFFKSAV